MFNFSNHISFLYIIQFQFHLPNVFPSPSPVHQTTCYDMSLSPYHLYRLKIMCSSPFPSKPFLPNKQHLIIFHYLLYCLHFFHFPKQHTCLLQTMHIMQTTYILYHLLFSFCCHRRLSSKQYFHLKSYRDCH